MKPTTKQEALARVTSEDETGMREMMERVEREIAKYDGGVIYITPSGSKRVRDKVAEKYRAIGWTVEFGDDQRDGPWMTLK